jgi:D-arabinose 1-dehydrogenase-like Zn-dependent alcohol dehydrogenase
MKVTIMGIGGLGHLAIQFAAKMGCEVSFKTSLCYCL